MLTLPIDCTERPCGVTALHYPCLCNVLGHAFPIIKALNYVSIRSDPIINTYTYSNNGSQETVPIYRPKQRGNYFYFIKQYKGTVSGMHGPVSWPGNRFPATSPKTQEKLLSS